MFDSFRASEGVLAERRQIAADVCEVLRYAGIPAYLMTDPLGPSGAEVEVDEANDEAGGVIVNWRASPDLLREVAERTENGQVDAREIKIAVSISRHIRDAMVQILEEFGFSAVPLDDDSSHMPAIQILRGR
jgi:hypothetical protein